jgi:curved DNA-binding protein CbpA
MYACVFALALGSFTQAKAVDFSEADALFAQRAESREKIQAARAAYQTLAAQSAKGSSDQLRATEYMARSYLYEINAYLSLNVDADRKERKALAGECWRKGLETINPTNLGFQSPVYWYFRANCLTREAEVSNAIERLANLAKLNESFDKGLAAPGGEIYEGGGVKRVKAAVKSNPEAKGIPGGLYNPEEALKLIDSAIESEAYPDNAPGNLFCENYRRKLSVLIELKRNADAKALGEQTVADFTAYLADDLVPQFVKPETELCIKETQSILDTL